MRRARAYLIGFAVFCAGGHLLPAPARAHGPRAPCVSNAQRDRASIVTRYGDARASSVWLVPGEKLCLTVYGDAGARAEVDVMARAPGSGSISVELVVEAGRSVLRLDNGLDREVRYRAALLQDSAVRESFVLPLSARSEASETWARPVAAIVLYDFALGPAPGGSDATTAGGSERPNPRAVKRVSHLAWSASVAVGAVWNSLDAINRDLRRNGRGAQSDLQPMLGVNFGYELERLALELEFLGGPPRASAPDSPDLNQLGLTLQGGYGLIATRELTLAPMLGFGVGSISVDTNPEDPELSIARLDELPGHADIDRTFGMFILSAGVSYRLLVFSSREGLLIGLRGGYVFQLGQSDWSAADGTETYELPGGPGVDASGFYVRLLLGFAG